MPEAWIVEALRTHIGKHGGQGSPVLAKGGSEGFHNTGSRQGPSLPTAGQKCRGAGQEGKCCWGGEQHTSVYS